MPAASSARCSALVPELTANAVTGAAIARKFLFKRGDLRAADELAALEHARYRGVDFGLQFVILGRKIEEADHASEAVQTSGKLLPKNNMQRPFPKRAGLRAARFRVPSRRQAALGEILRRIGDADVLAIANIQSLGADGGGNHRERGGHGFVNFQARASADAQRNDGHRRFPQVRTNVRDRAGDEDAGVGFARRRLRRWARGRRRLASNPGAAGGSAEEHRPTNQLDAVDVGPPIHGAKKDEIGDGLGARGRQAK